MKIRCNGVGQSTLLGGDIEVEWISNHQKWIFARDTVGPSIIFYEISCDSFTIFQVNDPFEVDSCTLFFICNSSRIA